MSREDDYYTWKAASGQGMFRLACAELTGQTGRTESQARLARLAGGFLRSPSIAAKIAMGLVLGLLSSTAIFLFLFWRLPKVQSPFRRVVKGALLAASRQETAVRT